MKKIAILFLAIGILLLFASGFLVSDHYQFISSAKIGKGTVIDLEYEQGSGKNNLGIYYPVITFIAQDGKTYTIRSSSGSNPPEYNKGEKVDIRYNPNNPNDVLLNDFFSQWGPVLLTGVFGLFFGGVGLVIWSAQAKRKKEIKWLQQFGTSIEATFKEVLVNKNITLNGGHPFNVCCTWLDTTNTTTYSFKSEDIWIHSLQIHQEKFTVLIDPKDPQKRNYMDISFLKKP